MKRPALSLVLLLAALLSSCVATRYAPTPQEMDSALKNITGQNGQACIRQRDIAGFGTLSDSVVSVSDKFRGHFLLVTRLRCPGLETSRAALFEGSFTEFCGRRDFVNTREGRCPIQSIFEFETRAEASAAHDRAEESIRLARDAENAP
ncbi:MAG: hypothetical protein HKO85_09525 [Xanthomonadales bacterium]|nr:hypothetical protein [Gammaproteobacteria bacterium]MBT8050485.1 hypothetical protein [Gammaproteobacteria bacterium]MBT8057468.1 hypothetical protein [Gammaproteobacteria bacterium]NNJ79648.1 hypothetical protein [Xanthomonadales bacterium]NNL05518.1 hypothetical protein [Xanthomonadales bacterium]